MSTMKLFVVVIHEGRTVRRAGAFETLEEASVHYMFQLQTYPDVRVEETVIDTSPESIRALVGGLGGWAISVKPVPTEDVEKASGVVW